MIFKDLHTHACTYIHVMSLADDMFVFPSVPALTVVPLQLRPGFSPGRAHCAVQAEEQQRPHVAGGRCADHVGEKGDCGVFCLPVLTASKIITTYWIVNTQCSMRQTWFFFCKIIDCEYKYFFVFLILDYWLLIDFFCQICFYFYDFDDLFHKLSMWFKF